MMPSLRTLLLTLGLLTPALGSAAPAPAEDAPQSAGKSLQGSIVMTRWSIDGGGTTSAASGSFRLGASIGQPDAALVAGGPYRLYAGFWVPKTAATGDELFANGFE